MLPLVALSCLSRIADNLQDALVRLGPGAHWMRAQQPEHGGALWQKQLQGIGGDDDIGDISLTGHFPPCRL